MEAPQPEQWRLQDAGFYACMMDCGLLVLLWSCRGEDGEGFVGRVYRARPRDMRCEEPAVLAEVGCLVALRGPAARKLEQVPGDAAVYATRLGDAVVAVVECKTLESVEVRCGAEGAPRYICYDDLQELGEDLIGVVTASSSSSSASASS
ncbi:MAG: hypothetical protein GXO15_03790 [Crenarchaeota archaeon]|nr:hypothetical protein [Thermoproteota archaeon]